MFGGSFQHLSWPILRVTRPRLLAARCKFRIRQALSTTRCSSRAIGCGPSSARTSAKTILSIATSSKVTALPPVEQLPFKFFGHGNSPRPFLRGKFGVKLHHLTPFPLIALSETLHLLRGRGLAFR